jgi:type IV fimbrial biogenesis protein FimT
MLEMTVRPTQRGFTMIELMVTVTIIAVMLGLGVPSFRNFIAGQKVKTASQDLMTALVIARSEAIKRNASVTVAPLTADTWVSGWTVSAAPSATVVHQQQAFSGVTITLAPSTVVFGSNGRPGATSKFQVTGTSTSKCVRVDLTGIPSSQTGTCP